MQAFFFEHFKGKTYFFLTQNRVKQIETKLFAARQKQSISHHKLQIDLDFVLEEMLQTFQLVREDLKLQYYYLFTGIDLDEKQYLTLEQEFQLPRAEGEDPAPGSHWKTHNVLKTFSHSFNEERLQESLQTQDFLLHLYALAPRGEKYLGTANVDASILFMTKNKNFLESGEDSRLWPKSLVSWYPIIYEEKEVAQVKVRFANPPPPLHIEHSGAE